MSGEVIHDDVIALGQNGRQFALQPQAKGFTDLVISEMNEGRLVDEALKKRSDLKVLYATAYS